MLQTQHQSIISSFGSPHEQQQQGPCPSLQNLSTQSMAQGSIYSPAHNFLPSTLSHDFLPVPAQGQPYIQQNLPSTHPRFPVLYGGPHQHRQILASSIPSGYGSNITPKYPLEEAYHGSPRHPAPLQQEPASRPSPAAADARQPRIASLLKPSPAARQNNADNKVAPASTFFLSAMASARAQESDCGNNDEGGGRKGAGAGSGLQERGRPVNAAGKAVLDNSVRPARAHANRTVLLLRAGTHTRFPVDSTPPPSAPQNVRTATPAYSRAGTGRRRATSTGPGRRRTTYDAGGRGS